MEKRGLMERVLAHPKTIVALIAAGTAFFALMLPRAQLDNNNFRFVPENDPARLTSARIDDKFGSQIVVLVGLERKYGTVLDADFLTKLRKFDTALKAMDVVDSVTSLTATDYIGASADGIAVTPLVPDDFAGTPAELAEVRDRLLAWDLYRRALVSDDFKSTQVLITLGLSTENAGTSAATAVYHDVKKLAAELDFPDTNFYITGLPVFSSVINDAMKRDLLVLIPLVAIVVLGVLFLSFRRLGGIVLPLLTVAVAAIWSIGAMALFGVKLSIISTVLPVILVAVGTAYGIHVVSHYYDEMAGKRRLDDAEHRALILAVLKRVGAPVFLAAITTFAGFGSLCFTSVVPIFEFGVFSSLGVAVSWLVSITLIPALLILRGPGKQLERETDPVKAELDLAKASAEDPLSRAIADSFLAVAARKRSTLLVAVVALALSAVGVSRLVIDNVMIEYFRADNDVVRSDEFIRRAFAGSKSVSLVVTGEKPGDVLRPDVLAAMDGLEAYLNAEVPEVGKVTGFQDLVKRMNQVFNADEDAAGLKPAADQAAAGEAGGFGFGDAAASVDAAASTDAGGGFGFGFADAAPAAPAAPAASAASGAPATKAEAVDALKLIELLNAAVAASGKRDLSAEELVGALAKAANFRGLAYYEIPTDPARYGKTDAEGLRLLIANYLVLLSGDIGAWADDPLEPKSVRMNIQLRTVGQVDTDRALRAVNSFVADRFPKDVKVEIGGTALVEASLNTQVVRSQLSSVASSLLMVFLILAIYYRSALAGLIGLAPLSIAIMINFGVMGALGIKLNIGTAMVASVAVGIGIDYTIHYMAAYHHEFLKTGGTGDFLRRTFLTSGKAIIFNAASVGAGFAVLAFSQFNILSYLGALITLTMGTSALVSLTLLPVLLEMTKPAFIRRPLPSERNVTASEETV
jgi:predicted RND superfamily exporter protein